MKVFINPGHGGNDTGACGFGLCERDIVLNIGNLTKHYLDRAGFQTRLLQFDGLDEIVDAANFFDADIFISIHCNAFNGVAHGTESFYFYGSKAGAARRFHIHRGIPKKSHLGGGLCNDEYHSC